MKHLKIIIVTGYSGSGKSTAIAALEDKGFYCVDNLPVELLPKFLELPMESAPDVAGLVFVMDLREKGFLAKYQAVFSSLREREYNFEILFLEADEETLIKRYSQTRRQHPLAQDRSLVKGIRLERDQLKELRKAADRIIDTSSYTVHQLKSTILDIAEKSLTLAPIRINILSFGYKYGIPRDADLIVDVRFLRNPYFVPELKDLNGESDKIRDYVFDSKETRVFLKKYTNLLDFLIPLYEKEGKVYLTIAVGCTGGRHRSVTIARSIFEHVSKPGRQVAITHRDIEQ